MSFSTRRELEEAERLPLVGSKNASAHGGSAHSGASAFSEDRSVGAFDSSTVRFERSSLLSQLEEEVRGSATVTRQPSSHSSPHTFHIGSPSAYHPSSSRRVSTSTPVILEGGGRERDDSDPSNSDGGSRAGAPQHGSALKQPPIAVVVQQHRLVRNAVKAAVTGSTRAWLQVSADGEVREVQLDRYRIQSALGVQLRDFRILDPTLSEAYPPCILCRERAIIVNLLHIKVIVTAQCVLLRHAEYETMSDFIQEIKRRVEGKGIWARRAVSFATPPQTPHTTSPTFLQDLARPSPPRPSAANASSSPRSATATASSRPQGKGIWARPSLPDVAVAAAAAAVRAASSHGPALLLHNSKSDDVSKPIDAIRDLVPGLPFELKAVEVCLEQVVSALTMRTVEVEDAATVSMEQLTLKVNAANLERVRRIKSHVLHLTDDVDTVRNVLDKLMDSEKDMAALALTARAQRTTQLVDVAGAEELAPSTSLLDTFQTLLLGDQGYAQPVPTPLDSPGATAKTSGGGAGTGGGTGGGGTGSGTVLDEEDNAAVVEMLLEAYTLQLANIMRKLTNLKEFILDTESLINLELDQERNNLIAVDLTVTFGGFVLGTLAVLVGLFGTNTPSGFEYDHMAFIIQAAVCGILSLAVWVLFTVVACAKSLRFSWFL